jgi:arylformamidase
MKVNTAHYQFNLDHPIQISISVKSGNENPKAFYAPNPEFTPVRTETFVGSTEEGGILNFKNIFINPHGNGTHTECVGHISKEPYFIKDCLKKFHFISQLVTIEPEKADNTDKIITLEQVKSVKIEPGVQALIIRTLPNEKEKASKNWSGTNPAYIRHDAMEHIVNSGIEHFLIDLPSVDREEDEGKLLAHKTFWNYPSQKIRTESTITEMIFAPDSVMDGIYLLQFQILPLAMDASPSNIILYPLSA